ncbi:right-handed parallel beta-helix repeat-containing protein, partial [Pontibacter harenae]|uniref:right-handed parallel beta-helix repeat-containing protein n=1 Tax=Pontibacter harenae TaxID=2894083 RepID=UPI001E46312E
MKHLYVFMFLFLLLGISPIYAETYYVSPSGSDYNAGTSVAKAWATVSKISRTRFGAGDTILFEGGKTFRGTLGFSSDDTGSASNPIVVSTYGGAKATISSGMSTYGVQIHNTQGIELRNLVVVGGGVSSVFSITGINIYTDLSGSRLSHVVVDGVEVYGYRYYGILIGSGVKNGGFDNVSITNASVHDIGVAGISSYADGVLAHRNLYIGHSKVFKVSGLSDMTDNHSGNGIMLGGVDGALVEYCEAYDNGWLNAWKTGGPVGIWGYHCNNLIIQYNEAHHNRTGTTKDGGGFDLDGGCTNSIMQYNYSHDNEGAGYLLAQYSGAPAMKNNIVRYNISENDGRKNGYAGIHLWSSGANGGIQNTEIYNNTVYITPSATGAAKAIYVQSGGISNANIRNNVFHATGSIEVGRVQSSTGIKFEGNSYWSEGGHVKIFWAGTTYTSLDAWRNATGQEQVNGVATGLFANSLFEAAGQGVTLADPTKLNTLYGYKLKSTSSLIGAGLNLKNQFGLDAGKVDFWGNNIASLNSFSIGAYQGAAQVVKANQSITFNALSAKSYGDAPFVISASASSSLPVALKVVSGPATLSGNMLTIVGAGTVVVEATQGGDANYSAATAVRQNLIINKAKQTVVFSPIENKTVGVEPFLLEASTSSGLPVAYSVHTSPEVGVAAITGNEVTLLGSAGTVTVTATQVGNANYDAAVSVKQSFNVELLGLAATAPAPAPAPAPSPTPTTTSCSAAGYIEQELWSGVSGGT